MPRYDDPEKMARMNRWLRTVSAELELPHETIEKVQEPLLRLISTVAHGPSRPGAPLTAFLVGYLAASDPSADIDDVVARLDLRAKEFVAREGTVTRS
ncbi:DUF6457 domain-containing protein [Arcanobacterium canis]